MLKTNGAGGDHNIAGLDVQINAAAGAGTDEGVRAALMQFLHGDGGGGAADTGGAGRHLFSQQRAGPDVEFPVIGHLMGVFKQRGNGGDTAWIAGEDAVPADIFGSTADMKLLFKLMHKITDPFPCSIPTADKFVKAARFAGNASKKSLYRTKNLRYLYIIMKNSIEMRPE